MDGSDEGWIVIDGVPLDELPEWARSGDLDDPDSVVLHEQGIAHRAHGKGSVARWSDVLGAAVTSSQRAVPTAYVLVPRAPPRAPWFPIGLGSLPDDLRAEGLEAFAARVRQRSGTWTYRDRMPNRPRLPIDELERRVRAREPVAGAVEVPVGSGPMRVRTDLGRGLELSFGTGGAAGVAGLYGAYFGAGAAAAAGLTGAALLGVVAVGAVPIAVGAGALALRAWLPYARRAKRRVLVMAPDGCVIGLHTGVRALDWEEIGGFAIGQMPAGARALGDGTALSVIGRDRSEIGLVQAEWFSQPLELIVAVADAYRRRVLDGM